jgi:hypothetical protein
MRSSSRGSIAARLSLLVTVGAAGCGSANSTGPHTTGLSIAAGSGQTDTVLSTLPQAVIVQLSEAGGGGGHIVQFSSVQIPGSYASYYAYVHRLDSNQPVTFAVDTTTSVGRADMQIVLGEVAGAAPIVIAVPDFGIVDTITFTATPGNAATIGVNPKDTAISIAGTATLRGGAVDSYGNLRSDPVVYSALSGPVTVSGATVTGTAVGPASVLLTCDGKTDTAYVSVVPTGVLAAGSGAGLRVFNLDGSGMQVLSVSTSVGNVRWSPSGSAFVFDQTPGGGDGGTGTLYTVPASGGTAVAVDNSPGFRDQWPQWSRDGSTIYYSHIGGGVSAVYHVTPSGSDDDSVPNQDPSFDISPSPSPDGTKLAYVADLVSTSDLRILTLSTGAVTDLHLFAWAPVWAPSGQTIAYLADGFYQGRVALVNADGSGQQILTQGIYNEDYDWSPDGQYIVASNASTGYFDLINVSTGVALPLPYTAGYYSPSWKPGTGASASALRASKVPSHGQSTFHHGAHR